MPYLDRAPATNGRAIEELGLRSRRAQSGSEWHPDLLRIMVVGVGDAGAKCVASVADQGVPGVRHLLVNSDIEPLAGIRTDAGIVNIRQQYRRGRSGILDTQARELFLDESGADLAQAMEGAQLVFVTAGMGGFTGTKATPYVAGIAGDLGAFVVSVVTTPFSFEGSRRIGEAVAGVARLRERSHSLVVIHSDRLLCSVGQGAEIVEAFQTADDVVSRGIADMAELLNNSPQMQVAFSDFRGVLSYPGGILLAMGQGKGATAAADAARHAIANPLLNLSVKGAEGVVFLVKGGPHLTAEAVNRAWDHIASNLHRKARVIGAMCIDEALGERVNLTLLATGL